MTLQLVLLSRRYCHLCNDMLEALERSQQRGRFSVEVVDIDKDSSLEARYGDKVPVLLCGDEEICHYFFDPVALDAYLDKFR